MREAGRNGFVPSLLRGVPQHGPEDLHIGENNEHKTTKYQTDSNSNEPKFTAV